jgi:response regulator RpfG family c-di-GMP phosphodiesterase
MLHGTANEVDKITRHPVSHTATARGSLTGLDEESAEPKHCLIVDDEAHLRRVLTRVMQSEGFHCTEASSGLEALDLLARHPATLVLTDLHMPGLDGVGLLREVRSRYPDTAVMLITAVVDVSTAVSCLGAGAMDYLTKPFHIEEVKARVHQALTRRRLVLENRGYQERLEERVTAQARRLEELFLASIQSLAEALEVKDPYTHGHSLRVAQFSSVIARTLGLDAELVRQIELGGKVHDIGKIGVREAVLNKPGALTPEEYQHIMIHPMVGWRLLSPLLGEVPHALSIVRSHHERFDGRGSPDGLRGLDIPVEARIAAIADTFDAMTSARPYRPGLPLNTTIEELRRCGGTQFDPEVLAAFLDAVSSGAIQAA